MHKVIFLFILMCSLSAKAKDVDYQDYLIGAGDVVTVSVYKSVDLKIEARVSGAGTINFPLIGEVKLEGITSTAAEQEIAKQLSQKGYIVSPQVNVFVTSYQSKTFTVLGNVEKPGKYPLDKPLRLTDAIAISGGGNILASDVVSIVSVKNGATKKSYFDLKRLFLNDADVDNPYIEKDDIIYVPKYPVFYIYGEVKASGAYRIERNMRVSQALAAGGGLTVRGTKKNVTIDRTNANGTVTNIPANLNDLLQPDDVIDIKESVF